MSRVKAYQQVTELRTAGGLSIKDITEEVQEAVAASGIRNGIGSLPGGAASVSPSGA